MTKRLEDMTSQEIGWWVVGTCLTFGTQPSTAHQVAAIFLKAVEPHCSDNG